MITGGITKSTLVHDLRQLGVKKGMTVIVHSSFKAIGKVVGGPVSVILALEKAVGPNGNLIMLHLAEYRQQNTFVKPKSGQ